MPEQNGEKSQDATPHRRQQAREKGQVAFSQDLGSAALLVVSALLLMMLGEKVIHFALGMMQRHLSEVPTMVADQSVMLVELQIILKGLAPAILPIFGLLLLSAVGTSLLQVGFLWVPDKLAPDISRLNPLQGLQRIFSLQGAMRLSFGLFKVTIIGVVAGSVLWLSREEILRSGGYALPVFAHFLVAISLKVLLWVGLALFVLALADYGFQRWKHEQDLKMTNQEVREEMKNLQGDPQIIARRKQVQRQMALNRMESSIPQADVVVTNPTELAIAIRYDPEEMAAPVVVAKGAGVIAQRIRRLALENNIPIVERKPLAQLLYKEVDVNHPVPDGAYGAVAEVLAYVYQLKGKKMPDMRGAA